MAAKRKAKPKLEDKAQSQRFVETARKLEVDDKKFHRVIDKLLPTKKQNKS
jgi:hypothetical protein